MVEFSLSSKRAYLKGVVTRSPFLAEEISKPLLPEDSNRDLSAVLKAVERSEESQLDLLIDRHIKALTNRIGRRIETF